MTRAQLQTIKEIFHGALDCEPDKVSAFLETACQGDEILRYEVDAFLTAHRHAGNFIEAPVAGLAANIIEKGQAGLLVGQTIGHYKISKRIGSGGMGEVYLATDVTAGRKTALKLLPMRFTGDAERLKRFQQEARAVVALNHPNILTVYEVGEDHSTQYIASELIEGETLRQRLAHGPMQLSEAVDVAIQVASALAAAHQAGIVHRDIKPENIMLRPDGYLKVLDFGIAKLAEEELPATMPRDEALLLVETNLGSILGTVRYMSPEQACGGQIDKATDIWSLGVVLYEMGTGHAPFIGDTPREVMSSILKKEPPPLTHYIAHPPAELQQIISKTLRKDRGQRYDSAQELLQALKDLRRKLEAKLERAAAPLWLRWARSPAALVLVLLVAVLALALPFYRYRNLATSLPPDKSIAVLPLENLSEEKENAYFADGVQDELLSNLAKIKELKVISRTSVMEYKSGIRRNLKEIAQQLGVRNVVEGSVRRSGDHVRVSVQLIDARTDHHLWGENYDRTLADSLSLQGDLATEIAAAVGAMLTPQEKARVVARPTNNPAAYDAYLRARAIPVDWGFALKGDIESAIHLYEQAVKLDPNFTLGWAYLSIAQIQSVWKGIDSGPAQKARAKDSLNHALALDPNLPEVHLARGYNEQDDTRALAEFRQAENSFPNSADVIEAIARMQRALGHWDDAVADLRRGIELDPRNIRASNNLALTYCAMRRFSEALATLDRVLAWDPTNARALLTKADALLATGDLQAAEPLLANPELPANRRATYALFQRNYAAAIEILSKDLAVDRQQRDPGDILSLAFSQQLAGDLSAARATYQKSVEDFRRQLEKVTPGSYVEADTRIRLGMAYAGLGKADFAIAEGQKAMALVPSSKHPEFGPNLEDDMARIYAQLGDADHAIPVLKRLLRTSYPAATFLTPATLRLDPIWDRIRNDRRFQELAAEKAP
jgi:serine/threonine protein kinase